MAVIIHCCGNCDYRSFLCDALQAVIARPFFLWSFHFMHGSHQPLSRADFGTGQLCGLLCFVHSACQIKWPLVDTEPVALNWEKCENYWGHIPPEVKKRLSLFCKQTEM